MKILVSGATGFIGRSLVERLLNNDHQVFALVRTLNNRLPPEVRQYTLESLPDLDESLDAFINLAGENIADKPWTKQRKKVLVDSRVNLTQQIKAQLRLMPSIVISMSAIGFYGSATNAEFDENTTPTPGFTHDLCSTWEAAANEFADKQTKVVIFRLGVVLDSDGGALKKMRPAYRMGMGGKIGHGNQWFSWVHKHDVIKAIFWALQEPSATGVYNLTSPDCVQQKTFATNYANSLNRPAFFTTPAFILRVLFGEMSELLIHGAKVLPTRLLQSGFQFDYENLEKALQDITKHI